MSVSEDRKHITNFLRSEATARADKSPTPKPTVDPKAPAWKTAHEHDLYVEKPLAKDPVNLSKDEMAVLGREVLKALKGDE